MLDKALIGDRYELFEPLGEGGMGVVYRGQDVLLDRPVAVKLLSDSRLSSTGKTRLLREAKSAARLNHPNIISVYDAGESGDSPYIVMELVDGELMTELPAPTMEKSLLLVQQVCAALDHAHAKGIIHRDLKPENIIITPEQTVKLMDFGLAHENGAPRLTEQDTIIGTASYLAPEVVLGEDATPRSDLYALGVLLYELVTGRTPFTDDNPVAVISQHLYAPVVPPGNYNAAVTPELESIIMKLLSKSPASRFASASEVRHALSSIQPVQVDALPASGEGAPQPAPAGHGTALLDRIVRGRLVGRKAEFDELRSFWDRAERGSGHLVLISGEPGVGKTRLAEELAVYARLRGAVILEGHFHAELGVTYLGFREAIQGYLRACPPEKARAEVDPYASELVKLIPEVERIVAAVVPNPAMGNVEAEQLRMFDHVTQFLLSVSSHTPILMLLDDLHWADDPSLLLLHFLLRNAQDAPVLVVGTYRENELSPERPFYETLLDLNRERLYTRLALRRLAADSVETLLTVLLDGAVDDRLIEIINLETEGNPFFVEEVVKSLVRRQALELKEGVWTHTSGIEFTVPQSIQVAIGQRLAGLTEDTRTMLNYASVLGHEFSVDALLAMGQWDEDTLLDAIEEAERAQLIAEARGSGQDRYAFVHALLTQMLYDGINTRRRARLHQRAGEALEQVHARRLGRHVEVLAHHFSLAPTSAVDKAVTYSLRAAEAAVIVYAHVQAVKHYTKALEVLGDLDDPAQEAQVWEMLGDTHLKTYATGQAYEAYENGLGVLERGALSGDIRHCRLSYKLGEILVNEQGDPALAREYLECALSSSHTSPGSLQRVKCLSALAKCLVLEQDLPQALEQAEAALGIAEDIGEPDAVVVACNTLCDVNFEQGNWDSYVAYNRRQLDALNEEVDLYALYNALHHGIWINYLTGDFQQGEEIYKEALELCRRFNAPGWEGPILASYLYVLSREGRWDEAIQQFDRVMPLFNRVGCSSCFAYMFLCLNEIEAKRGNVDEAYRYLEYATDTWIQLDKPWTQNGINRWSFFHHAYLGEWEEAWKFVEKLRAANAHQAGATPFSRHLWAIMLPVAAACLGRWEEALSLAQETLALAEKYRLKPMIAHSRYALGLALAGQGHREEALEMFEQALATFVDIGQPWDAANTHVEIGQIYLARGQEDDAEKARRSFEQALASFRALNAAPSITRIESALAGIP